MPEGILVLSSMVRRDKIILAWLITVAAALTFTVTLARAVFIAPTDEIQLPADEISKVRTIGFDGALPDRLIMPSIGVDAHIVDVGIARSGNMATPANYEDVGWYRYGPVPGQRGSAVMAGHVDNGLSLPGVFKHLGDTKVGDDVYVISKTGVKLHFKVAGVDSYPYKEVPTGTIFRRTDGSWLTIISCKGNWVESDRTYDQRFVVYAKFVD